MGEFHECCPVFSKQIRVLRPFVTFVFKTVRHRNYTTLWAGCQARLRFGLLTSLLCYDTLIVEYPWLDYAFLKGLTGG